MAIPRAPAYTGCHESPGTHLHEPGRSLREARGTRITVGDVLGCLGTDMSAEDIIREYPQLSRDDIRACLTSEESPPSLAGSL